MQRRDLNRAALALALSAWSQPFARTPEPPRWRRDPFSLGVASGAPRPDSVLLWTRLPDAAESAGSAPVELRFEVFRDEALREPVRSGLVLARPERGHSVHVEVPGLEPARVYHYRFACGDAVSPVGRTRTAPAPDAAVPRLRLALASCQHYEQGHYVAHREIAERDLDLVVFVGDYIYEGSNARYRIRPHGSGIPRTLDEYRARHALYKSDPDLRAAHAAHPWVLMWDDHEVVNDYADDRDQAYTPPDEFLRRRSAAYQAYFEHMPLRLPPDGARLRLHDRLSWGALADLWTLDCRQYRSHHACPDPVRGGGRVVFGCDELADPARSLLGPEQERWLTEGLASSRRGWRLLAQTTQLSSTGVETPLGRSVYTDAWDGYPEARRRLLTALRDSGPANAVTLGGDVHMNVAANLRLAPNDERSPVLASEIVSTSVSSRGVGEQLLAQIRGANPDIAHARSDQRGYALIDVDARRLECRFRATPHPARPGDRLSTQAVYTVEAGRAGVQRG